MELKNCKFENISKVSKLLEEYDICRLDIKRIYRYLDKNVSIDDKLADV